MTIGAPFNPFRVFQGVFAPFWILEHRKLGAGAKLCYIRLLGFAGKDARCYPSLDTLGLSLGVSARQARDYVKELERAGLIASEQRGLRRTNVYVFIWTAELEQMLNSVPDKPDDSGSSDADRPSERFSERNTCSGQDRNTPRSDRNSGSALDRNSSSGLDRNPCSGPIGINSAGMNSLESSSPSVEPGCGSEETRRMKSETKEAADGEVSAGTPAELNRTAQKIRAWAMKRGIQRLRSDKRLGLPKKELLVRWAEICVRRGVDDVVGIFALFDAARAAADRSGEWRSWNFLTIQIQLAAERFQVEKSPPPPPCATPLALAAEESTSEWSQAKTEIRKQISEISFTNWFSNTRQITRCGMTAIVAVPDEPTRLYLESEYDALTRRVMCRFGVTEVRYSTPGDDVGSQLPSESS